MADGTLIFDTNLDTSGLSTGLGKVGNVAGTAFKGVAVAVGAATTAIGVLTKSSLDGYASYEQLSGGVETLFSGTKKSFAELYDEMSAQSASLDEIHKKWFEYQEGVTIVSDNAANAYKTAGMSANQYMETVTSFSASLIQSLDGDTVKAAKVADMAIIDMSDNANKMGTSIEMIQNAYNGFAKGNFTMLDNLKLGYGGTKEEMQRLLEDAEKISGIKYDISSFADISEAIHIIQTEIGITGTTAKEASETIEGSTMAMKASWNNLLVGLADTEADLDILINQFVDSVVTVLNNILPRIEVILSGIGQLIEKMVPVIMAQLPELINTVLPDLIESGISMINSVIQGITDNLPALLDMAINLVMQLVNVLIENAPTLIEASLQMIVQLALGITKALPELIPTLVNTIIMIVETLIDNIDLLVDAAIAVIMALAEGILNALPILIEKLPRIVIKIVDTLIANASKLGEAAVQLIITLGLGLIKNIPTLVKNVPQIITALLKAFTAQFATFLSVGKGIVEGIWKGISNGFTWIKNKISGWVGNILDFFKDMLGIHSPSKEFEIIGKMCVAGFDEGIEPMLDGSEITRGINASVKTLGVNNAYGSSRPNGGINQTININREISTPDEMARAIRLESRYGLMKGVGFA